MSETTFAKAFLTSMDRKAVKLSSDYVSDPKSYPAQSPYVLPKPTHPFPRRERPDVAGKPKTINVNLKPMKASFQPLTLESQPADTTVLDLKTQYAQKTGLDTRIIKMLYNKRPAGDLKTLKELLPSPTPADAEFTLMIMGGAMGTSSPAAASPAIEGPDPTPKTAPPSASTDPAPLSERSEGKAEIDAHSQDTANQMLKSDEFWSDLKSFLVQRLRDESEGERLLALFTKAARPE